MLAVDLDFLNLQILFVHMFIANIWKMLKKNKAKNKDNPPSQK